MNSIDTIPLWAVFAGTVLIVWLGFEAGFQAARFEKSKNKEEASVPIGAMVGVVLSLTAFMLAFTFGVAAERFNDRRVLVIEEANAIGTTLLRSEFLPERNRKEVKDLLRNYVALRVKLWEDLKGSTAPRVVSNSIAEAEKIQDKLWANAVEVGRDKLDSDVVALFIGSLNETIDLQSKRVAAGMYSRLPVLIWVILYLLITFSMFGLGYQFGFAGKRKLPITLTVILSFSLVMLVISDLDRPMEGYLQSNKQPLRDLGKKLGIVQE